MSSASRTILLDADVVAYRFANGGQRAFKWGDGSVALEVRPFEEVAAEVDAYVASLMAKLKATDLIVCLSCPTAEKWRVKLWPSYTSRKGEKPVHLQAVKDYLAQEYRSYARPTLEADDIMGILSTHPTLVPGKRVIVSIDKDMKTIPGWLFNPDKDSKPRLISEDEADYWWMYQTLMGDTVDCYPGCPGVGPKKAEGILKALWGDSDSGPFFPVGLVWPHVVAAYEARGLTADDALLQARLARILRHTDYDFKKKEVILWKPH